MNVESLMALAREAGNMDRRCCIGKASGYDVRDAYAALESALREALAQPAAEPVAWQFLWTNPGDNPNETPEWKPIDPRCDQTMREKITELESYRYGGKPCYEVRALVVAGKETP